MSFEHEHNPAAEHDPIHLLGVACHGCLLIAETSCEQRHDWLDCALIVPTPATPDVAFCYYQGADPGSPWASGQGVDDLAVALRGGRLTGGPSTLAIRYAVPPAIGKAAAVEIFSLSASKLTV